MERGSADAMKIRIVAVWGAVRAHSTSPGQAFAAVFLLSALALLLVDWPMHAGTFQVTTTDDAGAGSLRQAILSAAGVAGPQRIEFHIPGQSPFLIRPLSQLPDVHGPIVLDASTQDGYDGTPVVELRGDQAGASDGLRLSGGFCEVHGLVINRFQRAGIRVLAGTNTIQGNFIGVDPSGKLSMGNGEAGVDLFLGTGNNIIGGATFLERNVISGNRWGIYLLSSQNIIQGNYIGLDADGLFAIGNGTGISLVRSARNQIGGSLPGEGNALSGNGATGLELIGGAADGPAFNVIAGNLIGLDATGSNPVPNGQHGILLGANATTNQIGGSTPEFRNVIAGNLGSGVVLQNSKPGNLILGNFVGLDRTGTNAVPNRDRGIWIQASGQVVGGLEAGAGNWIAYNGGSGVAVDTGTNNLIQANRIFSNGALGIALGSSGPSVNDPGDADDGPNGLQNYPELRSAQLLDNGLVIGGVLVSRPARAYTLEFFANPDCDPAGAGEGFLFLGRTNLTTASDGSVSFTITFPNSLTPGWRVTATAIDADANTSEFSSCLPVSTMPLAFVDQPLSQSAVVGGSVTFSASITGDAPPFEYELRRNGLAQTTNTSSERFVFFTLTNLSLAGGGAYRIVVRSAATSSLGVGSSEATLSILTDTDNDGLPDSWEAAFGLATNNAADASRDLDGDGQTNLQEYNAGTNPVDGTSRLRLTVSREQGLLLLRFNAVSNKTYTVQARADFTSGTWLNLLHWVARANSSVVTLTNPFPPQASFQFYRLVTPAQP